MGDIVTILDSCTRLNSSNVLLEACSELVEVETVFGPGVLKGLRGVAVDVRVFILRKPEYRVCIITGDAVFGVSDGTRKRNLMTKPGREVVKVVIPPAFACNC